MSDEQQVWDRQENEPSIWYNRFTRFRLMEPTRSIAAVFREEMGGNGRNEPPGRWYEEAKQWKWEERATAYDAYLVDRQEKEIAQERSKILKSRYALMHKRIERLDHLAQKLLDYTDDEDLVWLPDVKAIGNGPGAERVDLIQFNAPLIREIRGCFDDIASELGERVKTTKQEHSGAIAGIGVYLPQKNAKGGNIDAKSDDATSSNT